MKIGDTLISYGNTLPTGICMLIIGVNDNGEVTGASDDEVLEIPDRI